MTGPEGESLSGSYMKEQKEKARRIIADNIYMTIATASPNGEPWISPVFFAYDDAYNLYWVSERASRHSGLIRDNDRVAIVIFDSRAPEGESDGVYFEAHAQELEDKKELEHAIAVLGERVTVDEFRVEGAHEVTGDGVWRIYKAVPEKTYTLSKGEYRDGQYVDTRVEVDLT